MAEIILKNLNIDLPIYNSKTRSFKNSLFSAVGGKIVHQDQTLIVQALKNINLTLKSGDRLGLVGHNGAGKTTLLRVLAGVYPPTSGMIKIQGSLSSLTDITMGMDMELTGYENIFLRLVFMGTTFKQARELTPEIAEFSELEEYLSLPVRTYSTGMFLRLAFAISTSIIPDILILDEMMNAGDARFKEKAKQRTQDFVHKTKIMVLASHDFETLKDYCNQAILLEHGVIKHHGTVQEIEKLYLESRHQEEIK